MSHVVTPCERPTEAERPTARHPRYGYGGRAGLVRHAADAACCASAATPVRRPARRFGWDGWGVLASSLCVVHCVAVPLVLPALAMCGYSAVWAGCCSSDFFHAALFCAVAPVGLIALTVGHRQHRSPWILAVGLVGIVLLASALAVSCQQTTGLVSERLLTVGGSGVLIAAHAWNRRRLRG